MDRREFLRFSGVGMVAAAAGLIEACQQTPPPVPRPTALPTETPRSIPKATPTPLPEDQIYLNKLGYSLQANDRRDDQLRARSGIVIKPVVFYQYPPLWPDYALIPSTWKMSSTIFPNSRDPVSISWPTELTLKDLKTNKDLAVLIENTGSLMNLAG